MQRGKLEKEFRLNNAGIQNCTDMLRLQLENHRVERKQKIRIMLAVEEALLRFKDRFGEDKSFLFIVRGGLRRSFVQLELAGAPCNPLSKTEAEKQKWSEMLLTASGLYPLYSYVHRTNILRMYLPKKTMNSNLKAIVAILASVAAGFLLSWLLPKNVQQTLVRSVLEPFGILWIRILTVLSAPVIFLMICASMLDVWQIEEIGGNSRRVLIRYFLLSMAAALLAVMTALLFQRHMPGLPRFSAASIREILNMMVAVMPENAIAPFLDGNTAQLCLIALVLGSVIASQGSRTKGLSSLLRQGDMVGLRLTDLVSQCVPFFAALMLVEEIMGRQHKTFRGMWVILLISAAISAFFLLCVMVYVAFKKKVAISVLARKLWPFFRDMFKNVEVSDTYDPIGDNLIYELGLERHFARESLTYGLLFYMPANVIGTLLFTLYAAYKYEVPLSVGWLVHAMLMAIILFIATPPVPGANLLAYIMIFEQLSVPAGALTDAMLFEILSGIFVSPVNQSLVQLDLVLQADKLGLLSKKTLRKAPGS